MIRGLRDRLRRVGARFHELVDGVVDLLAGTERRRRLDGDDQVGTPPLGRLEPSHGVLQHRHHPRLVARELRRAQKRHLRAVPPCLGGDGLAVRRHDHAGETLGLARRGHGVADEGHAAEGAQVLPG